MTKKAEQLMTIVVFGATAAGKKNFIRRYCTGIFSDLYDPLTEISSERRLSSVSGILCGITLDRIPSFFLSHPNEVQRISQQADAVVLIYDGNSPTNIEEIRRIQQDVLKPQMPGLPTAVVVTKADAAGEGWAEGMRTGREFAAEINADFCVTSALWGDGVKDAVEELAARVLERRGCDLGEGGLPKSPDHTQ
ncbi:Fc.00g100690.m01.CDS01 [Cosmosporella sp. VM-42]